VLVASPCLGVSPAAVLVGFS